MTDKAGQRLGPFELDSVGLFKSVTDAEQAFVAALPTYRCPACDTDRFSLVDMLDEGLATTLELHHPDSGTPAKWVPASTFACANCGYITTFYTEALRSLANRNMGYEAGG